MIFGVLYFLFEIYLGNIFQQQNIYVFLIYFVSQFCFEYFLFCVSIGKDKKNDIVFICEELFFVIFKVLYLLFVDIGWFGEQFGFFVESYYVVFVWMGRDGVYFCEELVGVLGQEIRSFKFLSKYRIIIESWSFRKRVGLGCVL